MPWVRARLRGQRIFARATAEGELDVQGGRVEIRYKADDVRLYHASTRNLEGLEPELLPDDTCNAEAAAPPAKESNASNAENPKAVGATSRQSASATASTSTPGGSDAVIAYTDGACSGNPGPAGWGAVLVSADGCQVEGYAYLGTATNNVAELTAIWAAVRAVPEHAAIVIHTDSQYAIGVLSKGWKAKANTALIGDILKTVRSRKCTFVYVRGHAGIPLNERADCLAREAIQTRGSQEFRS
jgi:ribonuclease HI